MNTTSCRESVKLNKHRGSILLRQLFIRVPGSVFFFVNFFSFEASSVFFASSPLCPEQKRFALSLFLSLLSRSKANRLHPEQLPTEDVNFKRKKRTNTRNTTFITILLSRSNSPSKLDISKKPVVMAMLISVRDKDFFSRSVLSSFSIATCTSSVITKMRVTRFLNEIQERGGVLIKLVSKFSQ